MHVYSIGPIDCWSGWYKLDDFIKHCDRYDYWPMDEVYRQLSVAMEIAREKLGWEGDVREGPYIAGVPTLEPGVPAIMFAWKQDNNGQTFVASPFAMPWLEEETFTQVARPPIELNRLQVQK